MKVLLLLGAWALSWLPLLPDPFYHQEHVPFWIWLSREIKEVQTGERTISLTALWETIPDLAPSVQAPPLPQPSYYPCAKCPKT